MSTYYDDNFGCWEYMDLDENREFYRDVQNRSVSKKCADCGRMVKLLPHYAICDPCATRREQGLAY